MLGAGFRPGVAALIVIALTIPVVVAFTLVLVGLWITPAIVTLVSRRRFPTLERRHGASWWLSVLASFGKGLAQNAQAAGYKVSTEYARPAHQLREDDSHSRSL